MRFPVWLVPLVLSTITSCSSPPAPPAMPPFDTTVSVKELMANLMDPNADVVWESVGTIVTAEGTFDKAPQTDDEWNTVRASAIVLVESGNLLMLPARSGGNPEWIKLTQDMIDQSKRMIAAVDKRDRQAVFDVGADIYDRCVNCHKRFDPAIRDAQ
jgi:hypothetical protein